MPRLVFSTGEKAAFDRRHQLLLQFLRTVAEIHGFENAQNVELLPDFSGLQITPALSAMPAPAGEKTND